MSWKDGGHKEGPLKREKLSQDWAHVLRNELGAPYFLELLDTLERERERGKVIYPPESLIFNALNHTPFEKVKVVIVGQDPYHGDGQAHGLSFSVPAGTPLPPSLKNIIKEVENDCGAPFLCNGSLGSWADQGVLLLNAALTVRAHEPKSHEHCGWERFTDAILECLWKRPSPLVFMLWGSSARAKVKRVMHGEGAPHLILTAPHPSPLSANRGFFGCRHFSKANQYLLAQGKAPINWCCK